MFQLHDSKSGHQNDELLELSVLYTASPACAVLANFPTYTDD